MRQIVLGVILLVLVCRSVVAQATTYYISPTGSDSNNGLSTGAPILTFAYALDPSRASCGDTLNLLDGTYGDGTSTGKISLAGRVCTAGSPLTIQAVNQRQARIHDNGTGKAVNLSALTAWVVLDGIVVSSINNSSETSSEHGTPFRAHNTDHITLKNSLVRNPNKYAGNAAILFIQSRDCLVVDTEIYDYHRHAIGFVSSERMVARRVYVNPRLGGIVGGYDYPAGFGSGGGVSMYPCKDCIEENVISENGPLGEMNAAFHGILMSGSKVLGSISLNNRNGNGLYMNPRLQLGNEYSPTNILVQHNVVIGQQKSDAIRNVSGVNIIIDHNTFIGGGGLNGLVNSNSPVYGAATISFTATNNIATGFSQYGFHSLGYTTWRGGNNFSNGNGTDYVPSLPSFWSGGTASVTTEPQMGTCYAWPPDGSNAAVAGAGARILYRIVNGVTTRTPLWDPTTGEFPHGALVEGVNDVAGKSLFDVHKRLNVNTNGCSFPANYGDGVTDVNAPSAPLNLNVF